MQKNLNLSVVLSKLLTLPFIITLQSFITLQIFSFVTYAGLVELLPTLPSRCEFAEIKKSGIHARKFTSTPNNNIFLQEEVQEFSPSLENKMHPYKNIDLGSTQSCQEMDGFGFTLTESSVINISRLPFKTKIETLNALFNSETGAGFNYMAIPLSSTDFNDSSKGDFSVCDCKKPNPDGSCFDAERLKQTIEVLKLAKNINPNIKLMLKPWTTPPHMKRENSIGNPNPYYGGDFDPKWINSYSSCLADSVRFFKKNGFQVQSIAAQNEPGLKLPYPSTYFDDYDHGKLLNAVASKIHSFSAETQMVVRSDNFISAPGAKRTLEILNSQHKRPIFAAHCYSNDPHSSNKLLSQNKKRFCSTRENRELEYFMGECSATGRPDYIGDFNWWLKNRVVNDIDQGASGILAWNGILDDQYGPKNNGCPKCRGLLTADFSKSTPEVIKNPEYYALAHAAKFVKSGARRLILEENQLAFQNPDGSTVILLHNQSQSPKFFTILTEECKTMHVTVPKASTVSIIVKRASNSISLL
jgi:glucosylceramidase